MNAKKKSLRVYFVTHSDGRRSGFLMRRWASWFDQPPPAAYGADEDSVLLQLEALLQERLVTTAETIDQYLWSETFHTRSVSLDVHPLSVVDKQPVIGGRRLPMKITYAWSKLENGAFRVQLPRFGWWLVLEDLDTAGSALSTAVAGALMGGETQWFYDFRREGAEEVQEWSPSVVTKGPSTAVKHADEMKTVRAVADEWVERAAKNRLPKPVGASRVVESRRRFFLGMPRPSVLLVGGPGVGKTTELHHLARLFLRERRAKRPTPRIWATSNDRLLAGMIYVGMWQERVLSLVEELDSEGDYLYVDRLGPLLRPQADGASVADILAPAMRRGSIAVIAECTPAELADAKRRDAGFVELFQTIRVDEPPASSLLPLLMDFAGRGKRAIEPRGLKRALELLEAYRRDRQFPGKAFRFIESIQRDERSPRTLGPPDVEAAFARQSGLPLALISDRITASADDISAELSRAVIGQDEACRRAARAIAPFKAGLNPPDRPLGSLLFAGPTGVGKTELAKQVTRYLFGDVSRLVRIDMSELIGGGSAQRLLAAGRGVRSLAESVRKQPLSVVLFDEVEKAHPEAFDLLLGILGEARLTDALGRFVDFRMTLIIMTSNLGVKESESVGFEASTDAHDFLRAIRDHFRPEFLGRIDQLVPFRHLAHDDVRAIVDLQLAQIREREGIRRRGIELAVSDAAKSRLAELGYDRKYGARPLKRTLEARVVTPVSVKLASDPKLRDATLRIGTRDESADIRV